MVYEMFVERTKGVEFTDFEKQKLIFQIVKNIPNVQVLNTGESDSYAFHKVIKDTGNNSVLQTTHHKWNNTFHIVINLGAGDYNEYGSARFNELFPLY